jgi:hypothetical protein
MRMAMNIGPLITDAEAKRQRENHRERKRERRAQLWADIHREFISGVRAVFFFLLGVTILVFIVSNRTEISSVVTRKASRVADQIKIHEDSSSLQQRTLSYEKQVDEAAK